MEPMAKVITLDTRENKDEFIAYLADTAKTRGYDISLKALPFGDIQYENIIIERKEINDFVSSITSDRMFNQVTQMKANPDYTSIIALSGTYKDLWKDNKDKIPHLNGALKQITAWGIPMLFCTNDEELVNRVLELFEYAKPMDEPIKRVEKNKKMSLFMALPGVGYSACKKIMKEYPTMEDLVCEASLEDLQKILGPKKGQKVYDALRS